MVHWKKKTTSADWIVLCLLSTYVNLPSQICSHQPLKDVFCGILLPVVSELSLLRKLSENYASVSLWIWLHLCCVGSICAFHWNVCHFTIFGFSLSWSTVERACVLSGKNLCRSVICMCVSVCVCMCACMHYVYAYMCLYMCVHMHGWWVSWIFNSLHGCMIIRVRSDLIFNTVYFLVVECINWTD